MTTQKVTTTTTHKAEWTAAVKAAGTTLAAQLRTLMDAWVAAQTPAPTPAPTPIPPPPPIHPPDNHIGSLLEMSGGRAVRVASGEYKGDAGVFPHDAPLVLYADAPGEVGLDLSGADLLLDNGSSNIVLAGFKSYNGIIVSCADDFAAWWCDVSFPIEVWHAQYLAAGGGTGDPVKDAAAVQRMTHPVCKGIWVGIGATKTLERNRVLGCDVHDCGDDGVFLDKVLDGLVQGHRIWNIDEKGLDPGVNPWRPGSDLFHNDAIQTPGSTHAVIADGWHQQVCDLSGDNADAVLELRNLWIAGCPGVGLDVYTQNGHLVDISLQNVRGWSNGMQHRADTGWNTVMTQFLDAQQKVRFVPDGAFNVPGRLVTRDLGGNLDRVAPPGYVLDALGMMSDPLAPKDDPQNPALLWRAANPYDGFRAYFKVA